MFSSELISSFVPHILSFSLSSSVSIRWGGNTEKVLWKNAAVEHHIRAAPLKRQEGQTARGTVCSCVTIHCLCSNNQNQVCSAWTKAISGYRPVLWLHGVCNNRLSSGLKLLHDTTVWIQTKRSLLGFSFRLSEQTGLLRQTGWRRENNADWPCTVWGIHQTFGRWSCWSTSSFRAGHTHTHTHKNARTHVASLLHTNAHVERQ